MGVTDVYPCLTVMQQNLLLRKFRRGREAPGPREAAAQNYGLSKRLVSGFQDAYASGVPNESRPTVNSTGTVLRAEGLDDERGGGEESHSHGD
jgi:hypothetical protein